MKTKTQEKTQNGAESCNIKQTMIYLAEVEVTESPVLSCTLNLQQPKQAVLKKLESLASEVSCGMEGYKKDSFDESIAKIKNALKQEIPPEALGLAIYSRVGERPFFLTVPIGVQMETTLVVDDLPHIYPLVETRDTYHRFVVTTLTEKEARIFETTVGAITNEIMTERPDLRKKIGREWTRERYHNHKEDRQQRFVQSKIAVLEELVAKEGHSHLIISGSPKVVSQFKKMLPHKLNDMLLDTLNLNPSAGVNPIILEAINTFIINEHEESLGRVEMLESAVMQSGLGVLGMEESMKALQYGYADMLIIDQDYPDAKQREEVVRMAVAAGVDIETVKDSKKLARLKHVGCLLRYKPTFPEDTIQLAG